jgi:hypothetical protein
MSTDDCMANALQSNLDIQHAQAQGAGSSNDSCILLAPLPEAPEAAGYRRPLTFTCSEQTAPSVVRSTASACCLVCAATPSDASNRQQRQMPATDNTRQLLLKMCPGPAADILLSHTIVIAAFCCSVMGTPCSLALHRGLAARSQAVLVAVLAGLPCLGCCCLPVRHLEVHLTKHSRCLGSWQLS